MFQMIPCTLDSRTARSWLSSLITESSVIREPSVSHKQNIFSIVPKLQCADHMTLSTPELLQWQMSQMRSKVTNHSDMKRVHIQYETEFINSGVTYTRHLVPAHITPTGAHLYVVTWRFCSFWLSFSSFCCLRTFEEYNSYLCSSVAIFRLAQISGDPGLFLHLFFVSLCLSPPLTPIRLNLKAPYSVV